MFRKYLLLFLLMLTMLPSFAGEVENAMAKGHNVFLYLYTPKCKYCKMFTPNYNKVVRKHDGQFVFIKVDASTKYGKTLMYEFSGHFVPYVVMINSPKHVAAQITPDCLMDVKCVEKSMADFRNL